MDRVPEIVSNALVQTGYGESRKPARSLPDDRPKGFQLVWPLRVQGMALILRVEKEANMLVSLFPFFATGSPRQRKSEPADLAQVPGILRWSELA